MVLVMARFLSQHSWDNTSWAHQSLFYETSEDNILRYRISNTFLIDSQCSGAFVDPDSVMVIVARKKELEAAISNAFSMDIVIPSMFEVSSSKSKIVIIILYWILPNGQCL